MQYNQDDTNFLESVAKTDTGRQFLRVLKNMEQYYADIRNTPKESIEARKDALSILREGIISKLETLTGEVEPPNDDWR